MKSASFIAVLTAASLFAMSAPTMAADLIVDVPGVPVVDDSGFDWEGAYVGGFIGYFPQGADATLGGEIGYNFLTEEGILLGVQASGLVYLDGTNDTEFFVHGKVGGTFDNVAVYALGGVGIYDVSLPLWDVGVGVEIAVTDSLTWNAQISGRNEIGLVPDVIHVQTGLRFHF